MAHASDDRAKRVHSLSTKCSAGERAKIRKNARRLGLGVAAYLRGLGLGRSFAVRADEELARRALSSAVRLKAVLDAGGSPRRKPGRARETQSAHQRPDTPAHMIGMAFHLRGFTALAHYLGGEDGRRAAWSQYRNLVYADSLPRAAQEMHLAARRNERVEKPVLHLSISWAPEDDPSRRQMRGAVDGMLRDLGIADHQCAFVGHEDKAHAHAHVMANRIHHETGRAGPEERYFRRIQENLRRTERASGFRETPGHLFQLEGQQPPDRSLSINRRVYRAALKSGKVPFQMLVREVAGKDFDEVRSWGELSARLARHGLRMVPRRGGLVVTDGHEFAKCSSVARGVSRRKLELRFGRPFESGVPSPDRSPRIGRLPGRLARELSR